MDYVSKSCNFAKMVFERVMQEVPYLHQNSLFWTNVGPTAVHIIHQNFLFQNLPPMWVPQPPHYPIKISFFSRSHDLKKSFVGPKSAYISHQNFLFWKVT